MSLVYLMATNLLVMLIVLFTLSHRQLRKIAGYVALIAPIVTSTYFIMKILYMNILIFISNSDGKLFSVLGETVVSLLN